MISLLLDENSRPSVIRWRKWVTSLLRLLFSDGRFTIRFIDFVFPVQTVLSVLIHLTSSGRFIEGRRGQGPPQLPVPRVVIGVQGRLLGQCPFKPTLKIPFIFGRAQLPFFGVGQGRRFLFVAHWYRLRGRGQGAR